MRQRRGLLVQLDYFSSPVHTPLTSIVRESGIGIQQTYKKNYAKTSAWK